MWLFNHYIINNSTIIKHIFKIYKTAVCSSLLEHVIHIMNMNSTFIVSLHNLFRNYITLSNILRYNTCYIISLRCYKSSIFITILSIPLIILTTDKLHNIFISSIHSMDNICIVSILNVFSCNVFVLRRH